MTQYIIHSFSDCKLHEPLKLLPSLYAHRSIPALLLPLQDFFQYRRLCMLDTMSKSAGTCG